MTRGEARGFALILVLWITALLAVIAASLVSSGRTSTRLAHNLVENAKAEALADGAVQRAALGLLRLEPEAAWRADGQVHRLAYGGGEVQVTIADEDGKIDLNDAPPELLAGLLRQLGLAAKDAEALAERIDDARSPPDGHPFAAESELLHVPDMTPDLYRRLRPYITVFSGAEAVDPRRASRTVLAAIPGMTDQLIEAYAKAGPDDDPLADIQDDSVLDVEPYLIPSREVMYTVRAEAQTAGGGRFVREAVVELTAEPAQPFRVYAWRRGSLDEPGTELTSGHG
jgi:general secretion pathway protein K